MSGRCSNASLQFVRGRRRSPCEDRGARPPARPHSPRRRRALPGVGWPGLDVPLACAWGPRLPRRRSTSTIGSAARSRTRTRASAASASAPRSSTLRPTARARSRVARASVRLRHGPPARHGHTASDQVETILFRLASSGTTTGIQVRRDDGVVRPRLTLWRSETEAYCRAEGLAFRVDSPELARASSASRSCPRSRSSIRPPSATCCGARSGARIPRHLEDALLELLARVRAQACRPG